MIHRSELFLYFTANSHRNVRHRCRTRSILLRIPTRRALSLVFSLRYMRSEDRNVHSNDYPALHYPELYLLEGGYKALFEHSTVGARSPEPVRDRFLDTLNNRNSVNRSIIEQCWTSNSRSNADDFDPFPNNQRNSPVQMRISLTISTLSKVLIDVHARPFVRVSRCALRVHLYRVKWISPEARKTREISSLLFRKLSLSVKTKKHDVCLHFSSSSVHFLFKSVCSSGCPPHVPLSMLLFFLHRTGGS